MKNGSSSDLYGASPLGQLIYDSTGHMSVHLLTPNLNKRGTQDRGDDPEMLMSDLQNQFPNDAFEIIENDDTKLVAKVVDLIERPEQALDLPVDIRGTDLQTRVWDVLQTVPAGTTMNLTFLAEQLGTR